MTKSTSRFNEIAKQLMAALSELDHFVGYDLIQLGEHLGTADIQELLDVANALSDQGAVKVFKDPSSSRPMAMYIQEKWDEDTLIEGVNKRKSIIMDSSINLASHPSATEEPRVKTPATKSDRVKVTVDNGIEPNAQAAPKESEKQDEFGALTINEILIALSAAVERSSHIDDRDKWPLVEKIKDVACHKVIDQWLKTPIRELLK